MKSHHLYGSPDYPIRGSKLDTLMRCPGSVSLGWLPELSSDTLGGEAAQTGNLVHHAVNEYHNNNNNKEAGDVGLIQTTAKFPGGDEKKARKIFYSYIEDKENQIDVISCELAVSGMFDPLPDDPTGQKIKITGTTDQIRIHQDGELYIWDIKTGSRLTGRQYLDHHMYQISAYSVLATKTLGRQVNPGGLICTDGYSKKQRIHWHCHWDYKQCELNVQSVLRTVTEIRKGNIALMPSVENCKYCPFVSTSNCISKRKELINVG